jgi:putative transposase
MLRDRLDVSERWACRVVGQHRSTERYEPKRAVDDAALRARLRKVSVDRPRWGYRRAHAMLVEEGWEVNRKRVQRIWREEGLRVPQRKRKRRRLGESTVPVSRLAAERPNHVWALDYQHDQTADGRTIRLLNVVDEFTREALAMLVERSIDADATVAVLERLVAERGGPERDGADCACAQRLVPILGDRDRVHRSRLAVAERLRRVVQRQGPRRAAGRRAVLLPR